MSLGNLPDRNAGFAAAQAQVWGFDTRTGIDSRSYFAPGAKIFYVDPNNTLAVDAGNLGEDPSVPLYTVAAAVALCRAYMGDTIIVGANDDWRYAAGLRDTPITESLVIPYTKGGIRIVAAATNPMACRWTPAAINQAAITVHATDVLIEGFCFYPAYAGCTGVAAYWDGPPYGENLTVRHCFFEDGLDYGISLDYSWYAQIYNNHFEAVNNAAIYSLGVEGDVDYAWIHHNTFRNAAVAIGLAGLSGPTGCFIYDNLVYATPGVANFIDLTGGAGNFVSGNWLSCTIVQFAATTCQDATSGAWVRNHCIDDETSAAP